MLCFIQCWGFAGNWTNFLSNDGSFANTIRRHRECKPDILCLGTCNTINALMPIGVGSRTFDSERIHDALCRSELDIEGMDRRIE